jgi:Uma2 family endonuclease
MASLGGIKRTKRGVSWEDFEKLLAAKGDDPVPQVTYLDGVLELVTPSREHEGKTSWIGALIMTYAMKRGIELSSFGSWTLKKQLQMAGAEPDDCYIIGDDEGRLKQPHFVIEVQWSRRGIDKLEVYRRLGVKEVWFWPKKGTKAGIEVHVFRRGAWKIVPRSPRLLDLDLDLLSSFLDRPTMTTAAREFLAALDHA